MKAIIILKKTTLYFLLISPLLAMAEENGRNLLPSGISQYIDVTLTKKLKIYASPIVAELEAEHFRNLYDSLLKKGFSKKEAMQIVVSQGSLLTSGE